MVSDFSRNSFHSLCTGGIVVGGGGGRRRSPEVQYAVTKFSGRWRRAVQNIMLISLIWIFCGCRQMKGIQISNIRRHKKHFGLWTDETHSGW
jgi:hypothetical protein